ncbi:MAG: hypothetical protein IT322_17570 [Anaerolineae bacterium]|nr:hypothetical protein [Anaerolineae bacterium]
MYFQFSYSPHPYTDDPNAIIELWGQFEAVVTERDQSQVLLKLEWNLDGVIEWLLKNARSIQREQLDGLLPDENLAQALNRMRTLEFANEDEEVVWHDRLFRFYQGHSLRAAFEGSRVPHIILGMRGNRGEISLSMNETEMRSFSVQPITTGALSTGTWAYHFDMADFWRSTLESIHRFVESWQQHGIHPAAITRAGFLLSLLKGVSA